MFLLSSSFFRYCFEYPASIEDLASFDSLSSNSYDVLIKFLRNHKRKTQLQYTDHDMTIMMDNDTILYYSGGDPRTICYDGSPQEKLVFRFFDTKYHYAYTKELEKSFKSGIRDLMLGISPSEFDYSSVHLMVFTDNEGLQPYCENDNVNIDSDWFVLLEKYAKAFASENDLGKIVFGVYDLQQ